MDKIPRARWYVQSDTDESQYYTVDLRGEEWSCDCTAFTTRQAGDAAYHCKHIVRAQESVKVILKQQAKDTAPAKLKKAKAKHGTEDEPIVKRKEGVYDFGAKKQYVSVTHAIHESQNPDGLIKWGAEKGAEAMKADPTLSIHEAAQAPFHFRDQKAKIGTSVHDFIELMNSADKPDPLIKDLKPAERPYAYAFLSWLNSVGRDNVETIAQELVVRSDKHKYAGRMDWLARINDKIWLIDFKTSKWISNDYGLQLAAYKHALIEMKQIDKIDGMAVLQLRPDETFQFQSFDEKLDDFLGMVKTARWRIAKGGSF